MIVEYIYVPHNIVRRPLVLACGCFDLLTPGHVRHLQAAKRLGRTLCVLVTADEFVNKPGRPILPENDRAEMVDALRGVTFVCINKHPTAVQAILRLRPDVYVKGKDYLHSTDTGLAEESSAAASVGAVVRFTDTEELHTTDLLRRLNENRLDAGEAVRV